MAANYTYTRDVTAIQWTNPSDAEDRAALIALIQTETNLGINELSLGFGGAILLGDLRVNNTEWIIKDWNGDVYKVTNTDFLLYYDAIPS